jgi:hypothetical protein
MHVINLHLRQHRRNVLRQLVSAAKVLNRELPAKSRDEPPGEEEARILVSGKRFF